ncbi:MAG: protein kinase [Terracidiphilus sp.]
MKHCPQCSTGYPDTLSACPTHGLPLNEIRDLKPGMVVHHSYRIVRKLGQGGMGAVYLAQHTLMDEPRALKFLSAELSQDAAFTARFLREVRTLRQIRHPNVVDCGDLESAEDGSLFFSMEFVDGPDLRAFLRDPSDFIDCHPERSAAEPGSPATGLRRWGGESKDLRLPFGALKGTGFSPYIEAQNKVGPLGPEGSLPVPLALALTRQIAAGLAAAHARGMVHRDIKPENILLARDPSGWQPKIADFGIVATKEASTAFTRTGGTLLTVAYAAPEQWRGTPAAQLDGRTDLYALGGLLYEMLTGQTPFHAESYEGWAQAHQTTPPPSPSALRPDLANWQGLDAIVQRLLAKDREDRPKDVAELLGLLDVVRYFPPTIASTFIEPILPGNYNYKSRKEKIRRIPIWLWSILIGLLLVTAFAAGTIFGPEAHKQLQNISIGSTTDTQPQSQSSGMMKKLNQIPSTPKSIIVGEKKHNLIEEHNAPIINSNIDDMEKTAETIYLQNNFIDAAPLFKQTCAAGNAEGCVWLGALYRSGLGVKRDSENALRLFLKACTLGSKRGCDDVKALQ